MPMDKTLYPENWAEIAGAVKDEAGWQCEQCGRPCRRPGESSVEFVERIGGMDTPIPMAAEFLEKPGRFVLTVAHLDHIPAHCDRGNLRALCAPCHCRYDLAAMATKRRIKLERAGQLSLGV